jgi:TonB family protein
MDSAAVQSAPAPRRKGTHAPAILPGLFAEASTDYEVRPTNFILSFLLNTLVVVAVIASTSFVAAHHKEIKQEVISLVAGDIGQYVLQPSKTQTGGGGGGGERDKLQASKGGLPKLAREQFTPPAVIIRNDNPKLAVPPSVVVPPELRLPTSAQLGDPLKGVLGPPSSGTGSGGGIGDGSGGGVGSGTGPGVGPGHGGGYGGGPYRVGGGVSAPRVVYQPDPEYSEEARKARYQGTVVLWVIVGADGRVHNPYVAQTLGMGLDEKALESVRTWKFEPARMNGQPVPVQVKVEVNFRLY